MPQMKPMMWLLMMSMTLSMIMLTIIINFFTTTSIINQIKQKKVKSLKWKW